MPLEKEWMAFLLSSVCALAPQGAAAQWSVAPTIAAGPAIPAGVFRESVRNGVAVKAGVWMRAPGIPVGITAEGMYARYGGGQTIDALGPVVLSAVTLNATTRRHQRKLETYGVGGIGWYWLDGGAPRYADPQAPGFNVGVGEIIAVGSRDYFIELRLHAVRMASASGERWLTTMPILLGVRF